MSIFPANPTVGDEYSGYRWDGTVWQVIGLNVNAVPQSYVQTDPPALPREGSIWLDTDSTSNGTDATYPTVIYSGTEPTLGVSDAGTIWTNASNGSISVWDGSGWITSVVTVAYTSSSPSNPVLGQIWVNSSEDAIYIYDGTQWQSLNYSTPAETQAVEQIAVSAKTLALLGL